MLATLEQPTTQQVDTKLMPSVTYDLNNKLINATVIVYLSPDNPSKLQFNAPVIGVPGSGSSDTAVAWNVIWTLLPGSSLAWVNFTDPGLQIPTIGSALPDQVNPVSPSNVEGSPNMWQAIITHQVSDVNSFNYTIFAEGGRQSDGRSILDSHDPTIVVTLDPMG